MKKIMLAFEGTHFSEAAFEFARRLNELHPILLTGVFLPQAELVNLWSDADPPGPTFIPMIEGSESEVVKKNISRFETRCRANGIKYRVHKDFFDLALPALERESRFADLLILGSEEFYKNIGTDSPYTYLQDTLHDVECPVLLVPEHFDFPDSIVLAYNGSEDSVYAIKQFAYLFPELTSNETVLLYVNEDPEKDVPKRFQIYFNSWISKKRSAVLVSGSHVRSAASQLSRQSFVKQVISEHRLPVFIAYK